MSITPHKPKARTEQQDEVERLLLEARARRRGLTAQVRRARAQFEALSKLARLEDNTIDRLKKRQKRLGAA